MDTNFDLNINNYTIKELEELLELPNSYDEVIVEIQEAKLRENIIKDRSIVGKTKNMTLDFIKDVKKKLTENHKHNLSNSELINVGSTNIIKKELTPYGESSPSNFYQGSINSSNKIILPSNYFLNSYNQKTVILNYIFNTRFRNNYLNSIPQDCSFQLPQPIDNVVKVSLVSIQIPNVMLAFSPEQFTTQIYIKEDTTNYSAIVVIPQGNYDETTFPVILEKCINEQVINPFILPANYRFFVTIDPYTFFVTIKNSFYTFTMETITQYSDTLLDCNLKYPETSKNLSIYQTYSSEVDVIGEGFNYEVTLNYNTKTVVSDTLLKNCVFIVKKNYSNSSYTNLSSINFTLNSLIQGSLVLDYNINKLLDILFDSNNTDVLYVPLTNLTQNGNTVWSSDYTPLGNNGQYYFSHTALLNANLLNSQLASISTTTSKPASTNTDIYTLKIYRNKKFELLQNIQGIMTPSLGFYNNFTIYTNMDEWVNHNTYDDAISYNPFSFSKTYTTAGPPINYVQEYDLYQMMTGDIFVSQDPNSLYLLTFEIVMKHYPYTEFYNFPNPKEDTLTSAPLQDTPRELTCKEKNFNLSETYNYHFNDLDVKGKISELSISNTLAYQIGYRATKYATQKSYTSESAFDKTALDYVYFSVDDYNNSYLNHNYGVLPNESILDENIIAIVPIRSAQFSTTFDNGSDYIPKLRYYYTPVSIKKISVKLLDPLGYLVDINTNDYSFVLEITRLIDTTEKKT